MLPLQNTCQYFSEFHLGSDVFFAPEGEKNYAKKQNKNKLQGLGQSTNGIVQYGMQYRYYTDDVFEDIIVGKQKLFLPHLAAWEEADANNMVAAIPYIWIPKMENHFIGTETKMVAAGSMPGLSSGSPGGLPSVGSGGFGGSNAAGNLASSDSSFHSMSSYATSDPPVNNFGFGSRPPAPEWVSYVPFLGSAIDAVNDLRNGDYGWAIFNAAMAVSDVFLVKSLVTAEEFTFEFASNHYGNGRPIQIDFEEIDLTGITSDQFPNGIGSVEYFNLLFRGNVSQGLILGSISLKLVS